VSDLSVQPTKTAARGGIPPVALLCGVVALLALYPLVFGKSMNFGVATLILAGSALAWDILGGWTGQSSLGSTVFIGFGAYTMTLLAEAGVAPWWGALAGAALAALFASGWGAAVFRLRGSYFTLSTIAVAEVFRLFVTNESWLTNGAEGKVVPELPRVFGLDLFDGTVKYYVALILLAGLLLFVIWLRGSKLGFYLRAVREDEDSAMALGINPARMKLIAFMLSAAFISLFSSVYAIHAFTFQPDTLLPISRSIEIVLLAIIGGRGTIYGPLVGAFVLGIPDQLFGNALGEGRLLFFGVLILVVILFFPRGIVGTLENLLYRRNHPLERAGKAARGGSEP
jgi:branched-chain amino acid transport system permease protein